MYNFCQGRISFSFRSTGVWTVEGKLMQLDTDLHDRYTFTYIVKIFVINTKCRKVKVHLLSRLYSTYLKHILSLLSKILLQKIRQELHQQSTYWTTIYALRKCYKFFSKILIFQAYLPSSLEIFLQMTSLCFHMTKVFVSIPNRSQLQVRNGIKEPRQKVYMNSRPWIPPQMLLQHYSLPASSANWSLLLRQCHHP